MYANVNGDVIPEDDASVSIRDRGFLYGDAVFETLRTYNGTIFEWQAHADRLAQSCRTLHLDHGIPDETLVSWIHDTLGANSLDDAYVRLSITRGVQPGKLTPSPTTDPTTTIIVRELPRSGTTGAPPWTKPASASIVPTRRIPANAIPASAKTHNYLNGILARLELHDTSADEALLLDQDGYLTEGATSNLFFATNDTLCTPSLDGPVLPGITRNTIIDLATTLDIPVTEAHYTPKDLNAADSAFLTNTTWELRPLTQVDDTTYDPGPIYYTIRDAFAEYLENEYYSRP